uniref:F-box domain-containing protein n=1 Tax=Aureoumbra lagunensis TaxID=44058 RepID=A0A7S3NPM5_9STRA|mmetsp:Transcript_1100/g.1369  ORF Transcript_1100/g.1369 Transcript_1100/m.1369 type:complete len:347 (+) Transcript_1100:95-1135(+)
MIEWLLYLEIRARGRCLVVCKNWYKNGSKARFWHEIKAQNIFAAYGKEEGKRRLRSILKKSSEKNSRWSELKIINFECCKHITDVELDLIQSKIISLNLNAAHGISSKSIELFLQSRPYLKLQELQLFWHPRLEDAVLQALATTDSRNTLTSINLSGCQNISDLGLNLMCRACRSITKINITRCPKLTDGTLKIIAQTNGHHLQDLIAYANSNFTDVGYGELANVNLTKLQNFDSCGARFFTSHALTALVRKAGLSLLSLNLSWCVSIDDQGGIAIAHHCSSLQLLSFHGNQFISDRTIEALAQSSCAITLNTLDLSGCSRVSDYRRNTTRLPSLFPHVSSWTVHR